MKEKLLSIGLIAILIVMLFTLTGCGSSKRINEVKNSELFVMGKDTGYSLDKAFKKYMRGVKWKEYEENGNTYVKVSGKEKATGKKIEVIYRCHDNSNKDITRDKIFVDGTINYSYMETHLFKEIKDSL